MYTIYMWYKFHLLLYCFARVAQFRGPTWAQHPTFHPDAVRPNHVCPSAANILSVVTTCSSAVPSHSPARTNCSAVFMCVVYPKECVRCVRHELWCDWLSSCASYLVFVEAWRELDQSNVTFAVDPRREIKQTCCVACVSEIWCNLRVWRVKSFWKEMAWKPFWLENVI